MKAPNILLVNPWIYDFAAYDFWIKPIGLLYIASVLRKNGFYLSFIDCLNTSNYKSMSKKGISPAVRKKYGSGHFFKENIQKPEKLMCIPRKYSRYGISPDLFREQLMALPKPDVILVTSMMTYWYQGVLHVIRLLKDKYPDVPVILGGIYATLCPEHALEHTSADFYISGEGEVSVLEKVSVITGKRLSYIPDLNDLDSLPYPAFDLLHQQDALCLLTARGCPYSCAYCASSQLQHAFREREPQRVIEEIEYWMGRYHVKEFAFYDDALLFKPNERILPLLKGIITSNFDCNFHTPNGLHICGITDEVAQLLFEARFKTIRLGFETANAERQVRTGGKTTNQDFEQAVIRLRRAGYQSEDIGVYLLAGLPGQKADEVRESIKFVRDCGARPYLAEYSPIPGTQLWQDAIEKSQFELSKEPLYHNNSILPCRLDGLSWEELYQLKREIGVRSTQFT